MPFNADTDAIILGSEVESGFDFISQCVKATSRRYNSDIIFRGQANFMWDIIPTAFRDGNSGINSRERLRLWISEARRLGSPVARNYIEWLVLARHYGVATPLLDWTSNPLVALFFACTSTGNKEQDAEDGVIYYSYRSMFDEFWNNDTIEAFKKRMRPALFDATGMNTRSSAQDSLMTLHSSECATVDKSNILIRVPARLKGGILYALPAFGILDSRIFSDVALAAQRFNRVVKLDDLIAAAHLPEGMANEPAESEIWIETEDDDARSFNPR